MAEIVEWILNRSRSSSKSKPPYSVVEDCRAWKRDGTRKESILMWVVEGSGMSICPVYIYEIAEGLI